MRRPGLSLVPPQPGFYRLDSPKEIGFDPVHLGGKALSFLASIEHDLVVDLSCSQLLIFPHRLSHIALPSAFLVLKSMGRSQRLSTPCHVMTESGNGPSIAFPWSLLLVCHIHVLGVDHAFFLLFSSVP